MNMNKIILPIAAASLISLSTVATAADFSANANVEIVTAVSISEDTQIDFGILTNEDGTCTMASGGALTGSNGQSCTGTETPAAFTVDGTDGKVVDLSVTAGSAVDGVTYTPVIDGASTATLTGGSATVAVIGNLVLASATDGDKDIAYTFTANYQ
ncbi:hypothetical protein [Oceanicoccus sp. KOV_DT_Chl]|uniref:hypothetical protein n=1 Tax=Oceanicoccus sp. KOV_DT_Chl TaxID=1904639 RepID=UPI0011AF12CB|nr:hypothetical protein [Oceanicoccus sp. KOV_DT_Chl]